MTIFKRNNFWTHSDGNVVINGKARLMAVFEIMIQNDYAPHHAVQRSEVCNRMSVFVLSLCT